MPDIDDIVATAAAGFAVATWVVPPVRYQLSFREGPRDSLSVVGRAIGLFVLAAVLSAVRVWHAERLRWVGRSQQHVNRAAARIDQLVDELEQAERSQRGWVAS